MMFPKTPSLTAVSLTADYRIFHWPFPTTLFRTGTFSHCFICVVVYICMSLRNLIPEMKTEKRSDLKMNIWLVL